MNPNCDLSVIIPLYNEEARFQYLEQGIIDFLQQNQQSQQDLSIEIILVDDGSKDATRQLLHALKEKIPLISIIELPKNSGKGAALLEGVLASKGEILLTIDADMATPLTQLWHWFDLGLIPQTIADIASGHQIFIGSREHPKSVVKELFFRRFIGRGFNLLVQMMTHLFYSDTQCGFKLYPGKLAKIIFLHLHNVGWAHDIELLKIAHDYLKVQIIPLPLTWNHIEMSKVNPIKDGIKMFWALLTINVSLFFRTLLGRLPPYSTEHLYPKYKLWLKRVIFTFLIITPVGELCFSDQGPLKALLIFFVLLGMILLSVTSRMGRYPWPIPILLPFYLATGFTIFYPPISPTISIGLIVWNCYYFQLSFPYFPLIPKGLILKLATVLGVTTAFYPKMGLFFHLMLIAILIYSFIERKNGGGRFFYFQLVMNITIIVLFSLLLCFIFGRLPMTTYI